MINDKRLELKEDFLNYLEEVPSYRFASKSIKKSEDTTKRWRDEDEDFAEQCEQRISAYVKKTFRKAKPEFQLERLLKDDFAQRNEFSNPDGTNLFSNLTDEQLDNVIKNKLRKIGVVEIDTGKGE